MDARPTILREPDRRGGGHPDKRTHSTPFGDVGRLSPGNDRLTGARRPWPPEMLRGCGRATPWACARRPSRNARATARWNCVEAGSLEHLDHEIAAGLQVRDGEFQRQLGQPERCAPGRRRRCRTDWGPCRETTRSTGAPPSAVSTAASPSSLAKSAWMHVDAGDARPSAAGRPRRSSRPRPEPLAQHLRPAAGRGAEVDDASCPGRSSLSRSSSSISLNAARER